MHASVSRPETRQATERPAHKCPICAICHKRASSVSEDNIVVGVDAAFHEWQPEIVGSGGEEGSTDWVFSTRVHMSKTSSSEGSPGPLPWGPDELSTGAVAAPQDVLKMKDVCSHVFWSRGLELLYRGARSRLKLNGAVLEAFTLEMSMRQGCLLSTLLFSVAIQPLALLRDGGNVIIKVRTETDLERALEHLRVSGSRVNLVKSTLTHFVAVACSPRGRAFQQGDGTFRGAGNLSRH